MPKISVIMPVYNTKEEYLREAIESILAQTFKDFELIIVNDGSTNNAEEVIKSYKDDRIRYFYKENTGNADSSNYGIANARGGLIARMDSDDISLPERFAKQVNFLEQNSDISIVGCWFEIFPDGEIVRHPTVPKFIDFLKGCVLGHSTVMFRKADFAKYNLNYDKSFQTAEDYDLWSRAIRYLKVYNIPEVLLLYRWHETNISKLKSQQVLANDAIVKQNMLNFLTDNREMQKQIMQICNPQKLKNTFLENIFSIKLDKYKPHKVITIFGIRLKFKRK